MEFAPQPAEVVLDRLVMVSTSGWALGESTARPVPGSHGALLARLLDEDLKGSAWIMFDPAQPYLPAPGAPPAGTWLSASSGEVGAGRTWLERRVREETERCTREAEGRSGSPEWVGDTRATLARLCHRVCVDHDRLAALLEHCPLAGPTAPAEGVTPSYVALDFRFDWLGRRAVCTLSLTVWSAEPWSPELFPTDHSQARPGSGQKIMGSRALDTSVALFAEVAERIRHGLLASNLTATDFRVFGRVYTLPTFWLADPWPTVPDAHAYLESPHVEQVNPVVEATLRVYDARDCTLAHSVVNRDFLVLRRFRADDRYVPQYLVLPRGTGDARDQELRTARMVIALTDLETQTAYDLTEAQRDLEILRNYLTVYSTVLEQAAFLWDGICTHLPVQRWFRLGQAHRTVELLHQLLLQGVADLGHADSQARSHIVRIDQTAATLLDSFDHSLTERHSPDHPGLRAAMTRSGLLDRVQLHAREVTEEGDRVRAFANELLEAITRAFDERRVRESDRIQSGSAFLTVSLALIGVVTVLAATVRMVPTKDATMLGGGADLTKVTSLGSLIIGGLLLVSVVVVSWRALRLGWLGTQTFRRHYQGRPSSAPRTVPLDPSTQHPRWSGYDGVWRLLKDTSSEGLDGRRDQFEDDVEQWADFDAAIAARFAAVWDQIGPAVGPGRPDRPRDDLRYLTGRVERWGLQSLLLTERAQRMYRYRLPLLTCLYRCCTRLDGGDLQRVPGQQRPEELNMVARNDFALSLEQVGFTWADALELDRLLREWAAAQRRSAGDTLQRLISAGLRADTCDPAAVLSRLRQGP